MLAWNVLVGAEIVDQTADDVGRNLLYVCHHSVYGIALEDCNDLVVCLIVVKKPYRSYPSGVTASASKRHEYIRWSGKGERYIIEDDFESEFSVSTKPMETLFSLSEYDNVIYLNTFSKTISPAIRVAYIVLPKKLVTIFYEKLGFYSCTVPTFEQFMLTDLLNSGEFERYINRVRRNKRKELGK